ncbi:MAG: hypothetical protein IJS61_00990 [Firmicutes bacterium]|nr:hypothetical protein [Bacillota bacterium]
MNKKILKYAVNIVVLAVVMVVGFYVGSFVSNRNKDEGKTRIAGNATQYAEDRDNSNIEESPNIAYRAMKSLISRRGRRNKR